VNIPEQELMEVIFEEGYSRLPVYDSAIDNIVGVLYVKDILSLMRLNEPIIIEKLMRPAYFVPETKKIPHLLQQFQRRHMHMAIVTDEFGGVSGIATIEDIIEELVGEIQDEYDEEVPIVERLSDFEYRVNGAAPVSDANDYMPFPLPEGEDYETVGGLVTMVYGHIPDDLNEMAQFNEYEIRVLEKSDRRVEWVLFTIREELRSQVAPSTTQKI
jgi:CBS domain containing-hemolysin-like protein